VTHNTKLFQQKEEAVMRRYSFPMFALALAMLLMTGLTWAEGLSSVDTGHHGPGGEGCHGAASGHGAKGCAGLGGCHATMAGGAGHDMTGMHRGRMERGRRSGRHMGWGMDVPRLGGPDHFIRMAEHLELTEEQR
jgi:hypothetical protein